MTSDDLDTKQIMSGVFVGDDLEPGIYFPKQDRLVRGIHSSTTAPPGIIEGGILSHPRCYQGMLSHSRDRRRIHPLPTAVPRQWSAVHNVCTVHTCQRTAAAAELPAHARLDTRPPPPAASGPTPTGHLTCDVTAAVRSEQGVGGERVYKYGAAAAQGSTRRRLRWREVPEATHRHTSETAMKGLAVAVALLGLVHLGKLT